MCGRYTLFSGKDLKKRFGIFGDTLNFKQNYNIAPSSINPVIVNDGKNKLQMMKWGLVPFWAKDKSIGFRMINARSEEIDKKPSFRIPIRKKRCLIPANGFYEWGNLNLEGKTEKYPFYFTLKDNPFFSFAGIYDQWEKEGELLESYSIITTKANDLVSQIHSRMPVILKREDEEKWLDSGLELKDALSLLQPFDPEKMKFYPVSKEVNNPENNSPKLIDML